MTDTMRLGDVHPDMDRYLREDCYCPNEIYDCTGFFYDLFEPDTECALVTQTEDASVVIACGSSNPDRPQVIYFWHDEGDGRIVDAERYDATENNIGIMRDIAHGVKPDGRKFDEYEDGSTARSLQELLSISDFVIRD